MSRVWQARAHEAEHVARLLLAFRDWLHDDEPSEASVAVSVARLLADDDTEFLLGSVDDAASAPCGICQLRYRHSVWTGAPDCWLEDLYVEAAARGRGVGRALVAGALERARARGARRIELDTNADNTGAIALYESLGFSGSSKAHGHLQGRDMLMGRPL